MVVMVVRVQGTPQSQCRGQGPPAQRGLAAGCKRRAAEAVAEVIMMQALVHG